MQWITSPLIKSLAVDRKCTIRAVEKSGRLLAPYFASHVSEAALKLADHAESSIAHPLMNVLGTLNPIRIYLQEPTPKSIMSVKKVFSNVDLHFYIYGSFTQLLGVCARTRAENTKSKLQFSSFKWTRILFGSSPYAIGSPSHGQVEHTF